MFTTPIVISCRFSQEGMIMHQAPHAHAPRGRASDTNGQPQELVVVVLEAVVVLVVVVLVSIAEIQTGGQWMSCSYGWLI